MPRFSVLHDISRALQSQIIGALGSAPDVSFDADDTTIVLQPPSEGLGTDVQAALYLYHIAIDPHLRNQQRLPDGADPSLFIRPPLPLQLRYLFVPLGEVEADNQLLLGRVLQHFHDAPTFRPAPGSPLAVNRGGVPETLRVRVEFAGFEALSQLWSALSRPFRLSAGFMVDIAALDSAAGSQAIPRVAQTATTTGRKEVAG